MTSKEKRDEIVNFFITQGPWIITRACAVECAIITITCLIDTHITGSEYTKSEMIEVLALLNKEKDNGTSKSKTNTTTKS